MITEAADVLYYYILNEHRDVADLRSQGGTCKANVLQLPLQRSVKMKSFSQYKFILFMCIIEAYSVLGRKWLMQITCLTEQGCSGIRVGLIRFPLPSLYQRTK